MCALARTWVWGSGRCWSSSSLNLWLPAVGTRTSKANAIAPPPHTHILCHSFWVVASHFLPQGLQSCIHNREPLCRTPDTCRSRNFHIGIVEALQDLRHPWCQNYVQLGAGSLRLPNRSNRYKSRFVWTRGSCLRVPAVSSFCFWLSCFPVRSRIILSKQPCVFGQAAYWIVSFPSFRQTSPLYSYWHSHFGQAIGSRPVACCFFSLQLLRFSFLCAFTIHFLASFCQAVTIFLHKLLSLREYTP